MKLVKFLKSLMEIVLTLVILCALTYAAYRFALPKTWRQQIEQTIVELKGEIEPYEDSGITGEGYTIDETFCPYYGHLSENTKRMYLQVYANALEMKTSFVPAMDIRISEVKNAINAVYHDHPELFWLESGCTYRYKKEEHCLHVTLKFNELADDIENAKKLFNEKADAIISQAVQLDSDYAKEKYVFHTMLDQIEYDSNTSMHQSPYSALVYGKTVCAGYARAFQYIMVQLGVPTYYCTGETQGHAWNIIKLDDGYYNVDLSRADTTQLRTTYLNRTDKGLKDTHKRSGYSTVLPQCRAKKYCEVEWGIRDFNEHY